MGIGQNAVGDYAKRTGSPAISMTGGTDKVTMAGWYQIRDASPSQYAIPFGFESTDTSATAWAVFYISATNEQKFGTNTSSNDIEFIPNQNEWYYFYIIGQNTNDGDIDWDAGFFLENGTSPASSIGVVDNVEWDIARVCVGNDSWDEWTDCVLAQVRVWTTKLTAIELFVEKQSATAVKTANLWADWPLVGNTDNGDDSGNGRNLTFGGTLTTENEPPNLPAFPNTALIDDFERTENPLSTFWARASGLADYSHRAGSGSAVADASEGAVHADYFTDDTFDDIDVFVSIPSVGSSNTSTGVLARSQNPTNPATVDAYLVEFVPYDNSVSLYRCIDADYGSGIYSITRSSFTDGHKLGMRVSGTGTSVIFRIYTDEGGGWSLRGYHEDTDVNRITNPGYTGIQTYRPGTDNPALDDFGGYPFSPSASLADDFNRANQISLGGYWEQTARAGSTFRITSNHGEALNLSEVEEEYNTLSEWGPDMDAYIQLLELGGGVFCSLGIRTINPQSVSMDSYYVQTRQGVTMQLWKLLGGSDFGISSEISMALGASNLMGISAKGTAPTTLRMWRNTGASWHQVGYGYTDSSIQSKGYISLAAYLSGGSPDNLKFDDLYVQDFGGGSVAVTASGTYWLPVS